MKRFRFILPAITLLIGLFAGVSPAEAALFPLAADWSDWWLPTPYSTHAGQIDSLFTWIFWITMVTLVAVQVTLVVFLIKYRRRAGKKKAVFTHGNTRLEMAWTIIPSFILAGIALASVRVWNDYRFSPTVNDPNLARILVIGQQFKWNFIYAGPDGKLGRYLIFPRPTDVAWPAYPADPSKPDTLTTEFQNTPGPASLPHAQAIQAIGKYIDQINPLGKDFTDEDGKDDDWEKLPGRELNVPVDRPIEIQLTSKDVIHDFFLPNYRVKLDAVPGMRGFIHFTATTTSKNLEQISEKPYTDLDQLAAELKRPENSELTVRIDENSIGAVRDIRGRKEWLYKDAAGTIVRQDRAVTPDMVERLKAAGVTSVRIYRPGYWDIVCEELCGQGHYTMQAQMFVLKKEEYAERFEKKSSPPTPPVSPTPSVSRSD